jgi:hypothetical protein
MSVLDEVVAAAEPSLRRHAVADPGPGRFEDLVADSDRLFVLESVYEGYLMHYDAPRAFERMDADLRLLAGDSLYALGLARLAAGGDLAAVSELGDLISLSAQAHAQGRPEIVEELWAASARSLAGEPGGGARAAVAGRL